MRATSVSWRLFHRPRGGHNYLFFNEKTRINLIPGEGRRTEQAFRSIVLESAVF
jgi:hypothetical protein